jgi:hypothetical protein
LNQFDIWLPENFDERGAILSSACIDGQMLSMLKTGRKTWDADDNGENY